MGHHTLAAHSRRRHGRHPPDRKLRRYQHQLHRPQARLDRTRSVPLCTAEHHRLQRHNREVGNNRSTHHAAHGIRLQRSPAVHRLNLHRRARTRLALPGRRRCLLDDTHPRTVGPVPESGHRSLGKHHQALVTLLLRASHRSKRWSRRHTRNRALRCPGFW